MMAKTRALPTLLAPLLLLACEQEITPIHPEPHPSEVGVPDDGPGVDASDPIPPDASPDVALVLDSAPGRPDLGENTPDLAVFEPDLGPDGGIALDAAPDVRPDGPPDAAPDALPRDMQPDGPPPPPREQCFGEVDDDGDGLIDCADPDCRPSVACFEAREDCGNGVDDDGDLRADCADRYCLADPRCPPPDVAPFTTAELQARFDFECSGCHGPVQPFSSLDLSAPFEDAVVDVGSVQTPMQLVKPGDRSQSFLYLKLTFRHLAAGGDGEGMPPAFEGYLPWSAEEAERLGRWIDGLGTD